MRAKHPFPEDAAVMSRDTIGLLLAINELQQLEEYSDEEYAALQLMLFKLVETATDDLTLALEKNMAGELH